MRYLYAPVELIPVNAFVVSKKKESEKGEKEEIHEYRKYTKIIKLEVWVCRRATRPKEDTRIKKKLRKTITSLQIIVWVCRHATRPEGVCE